MEIQMHSIYCGNGFNIVQCNKQILFNFKLTNFYPILLLHWDGEGTHLMGWGGNGLMEKGWELEETHGDEVDLETNFCPHVTLYYEQMKHHMEEGTETNLLHLKASKESNKSLFLVQCPITFMKILLIFYIS